MRQVLRPFAAMAVAAGLLLAGLAGGMTACAGRAESAGGAKVIVLGFDGMDYGLVKRLMDEGKMPNFTRLAAEGVFQPLETSVPPQSPVAWSDFITGLDAGGHGIFDFVHRDPATLLPYLSTSRAEQGEPRLKLGRYQIPGEASVELLRHGTPFWEVLEERGVETTIVRMPANFPPSGSASRELSGMGTPDFLGTPGTFSFYTSELFAFQGADVSGGKVYEIYPSDVDGTVFEAELHGPPSPFLQKPENSTVPFTVYVDPREDAALIEVGDERRLLAVGEWSDWVPVVFELEPFSSAPAMTRFYLKQAHPELELYATPLQIDPMNPAVPISHPPHYAAELAEATGRFYTQGMPEDTKTLTNGVFDRDEFLAQADLTGREILDQYRYVLANYDGGLLFYYFGNLDQKSHMMFRTLDPQHPAYDPENDPRYADVIVDVYRQLDDVVGYTLAHMPPGTHLIAMSDHGFTSWRRAFHLNTWLVENGYLVLKDPSRRGDQALYTNVDWSRTRAYALGINSLYINLRGRERSGAVNPANKEKVMDELAEKLLAALDPVTGEPAITRVYRSDRFYEDRGFLDIGPDIQVGYAKGVRGSNESALGGVGTEVMTDNTEEWSGDHCMDHEAVPGILLTNRPLARPATRLKDLGAAILADFGIEDFPRPAPSAAG